jgi:hypothetical protein
MVVNGGVIDRDAAILQHKFEIAVADGELEIPAHGPKDHLGSELSPLELLAPIPHCRPRLASNRTDLTRGTAASKARNRTMASAGMRKVQLRLCSKLRNSAFMPHVIHKLMECVTLCLLS